MAWAGRVDEWIRAPAIPADVGGHASPFSEIGRSTWDNPNAAGPESASRVAAVAGPGGATPSIQGEGTLNDVRRDF